MWPYWLLFLIPALAAAIELQASKARSMAVPQKWNLGWVAIAGLMTGMVGFRFEVGGDWYTYLDYLDVAASRSFFDSLLQSDPGYHLLNWVSVRMDWGVLGVNLIGGAIFTAGLIAFCRSLPRPWLALTVAVPYLVIVVAMGYSRQGIALALAMVGLMSLERGRTTRFIVWVLLGATFHKTAVLLLPMGALVHSRGRLLRATWVAIAAAAAYYVLLADSAEDLYVNYVEAEYQSEGALIRLLMNAVPALLILGFRRQFRASPLWLWFSWLSLLLLGVLFVSPSSTAVDRVALYMLPLQLVVFSSLPMALAPNGARSARFVATGVVVYYALVLFVWLHFASHSAYWLPYRFYVIETLR